MYMCVCVVYVCVCACMRGCPLPPSLGMQCEVEGFVLPPWPQRVTAGTN